MFHVYVSKAATEVTAFYVPSYYKNYVDCCVIEYGLPTASTAHLQSSE